MRHSLRPSINICLDDHGTGKKTQPRLHTDQLSRRRTLHDRRQSPGEKPQTHNCLQQANTREPPVGSNFLIMIVYLIEQYHLYSLIVRAALWQVVHKSRSLLLLRPRSTWKPKPAGSYAMLGLGSEGFSQSKPSNLIDGRSLEVLVIIFDSVCLLGSEALDVSICLEVIIGTLLTICYWGDFSSYTVCYVGSGLSGSKVGKFSSSSATFISCFGQIGDSKLKKRLWFLLSLSEGGFFRKDYESFAPTFDPFCEFALSDKRFLANYLTCAATYCLICWSISWVGWILACPNIPIRVSCRCFIWSATLTISS